MNHPIKAVGIGALYFIFLVAIPLGFVMLVSSYIAQSGGDPTRYFHGTSMYILILGTLASIFASLGAYYEKGGEKRLAFGLTSSVFLALWGYFFIASMSIYYEGDTYAYEVLVPGIAVALAISLSFKIIYRIVEYYVYKNEYGNEGEPRNGMKSEQYPQEDEEIYF